MVEAREHFIEVPRTAKYATLGEPSSSVSEVWVVLHGYRQLAKRFIRRFAGIATPERWILAPESLNRFYIESTVGRHGVESRVGGTWMTKEERGAEIIDYVRYLDLLSDHVFSCVPRESVRLNVLGFSQGLHTAARWAVLGRHRPERLILWADYLPPDWPMEKAAEALSETEVVIARGTKDPSAREDLRANEQERLTKWSIAHELVTFEGGHEIHAPTLLEIANRRS